eukprot:scaffold102191_cov63-Phaeocystis_antarctica.AAC.1
MSAGAEAGAADGGVMAGTTMPSMLATLSTPSVSATCTSATGVDAFFEYFSFFWFLAFPFMLGPGVRVKWLPAAIVTGEENATLPAPKRASAMLSCTWRCRNAGEGCEGVSGEVARKNGV